MIQVTRKLSFVFLVALTGCTEKESDFDSHSGRDPDQALQSSYGRKGGPVEHIDAKERREAALLDPVRGPVKREILLYRADIRSAFEEENFTFLEEQAEMAREGLPVFGNGSTQIIQFYEGVADRYSRSRDQLILDEERIQEWMEEKPGSATARIALGKLLIDTAWVVRGSGWASTVGEEQSQLYHRMLQGANKLVGPLIGEKMKDPYAGVVMMRVALGQSWDSSQYAQLLTILEDRFPTFWKYRVQRAYSLLPRWHGTKGEWETYALENGNFMV